MKINRCFIIGSGNSISTGIDKGLWNYLKNEITISCNYNFLFFPEATVILFFDAKFYIWNKETIEKMPLVISGNRPQVKKYCLNSNVYLLPLIELNKKECTNKEAWTKGFYSGHWAGNLATSLAIALGYDEIYLLGMDLKEINGKTHYYGELNHPDPKTKEKLNKGVGKHYIKNKGWLYKTSTFNNPKEAMSWWKPFNEIPDLKIINVSPDSLLTYFPKITYDELFRELRKHPQNILQSVEREKIKNIIIEKLK